MDWQCQPALGQQQARWPALRPGGCCRQPASESARGTQHRGTEQSPLAMLRALALVAVARAAPPTALNIFGEDSAAGGWRGPALRLPPQEYRSEPLAAVAPPWRRADADADAVAGSAAATGRNQPTAATVKTDDETTDEQLTSSVVAPPPLPPPPPLPRCVSKKCPEDFNNSGTSEAVPTHPVQ